MRSTLDVVLGSQVPRLLVTPPSSGTAGHDLIELCEGVGMEFDPAQKLALVEICAESSPGKWAAMETLVEECRQNGKGLLIEALQIGDLFLFESSLLSTYSAHEFPTAMEQFRRLCFWIENNDDLRRRCKKPTTGSNNVSVETLDGRRVKFRARTNDGGRGLTGDRIILDEAFDLPKLAMGALVPSLSAVPNPQINYCSSTGFGATVEKSDVLWTVRRQALVAALQHLGRPLVEPEGEFHARNVPGAHVYINHSASPSAVDDLYNEDHVAEANPAYGRRIFWSFVSDVEQKRMTREQYARERLGIWDGTRKLEDDDESTRWSASWPSLLDPLSSPLDPVVVVLDASPGLESAALGVAGWRDDGLRHVEVVDHRPGSEWVVARTVAVCESAGVNQVHVPPGSPALSFAKDLEAKGLEVVKPSSAVYGAACGEFVAAVRGGLVRHRSGVFDRVLADAVGSAVRRESADVFTWSRTSSAVDICPLVAVTLAFHLVPQRVEADRPVFAY